MGTTRFLVITSMILAAAAARLIPHPPNFTPIGAMALFAGVCLAPRWTAFLVPLAAMALSDLLLYQIHTRPPEPAIYLGFRAIVYGCFAVMVCVGFWLRSRYTVLRLVGAMLGSSVLFFVVTNFAVWALGQGLDYPKTLTGLIACYVAAIPFFQNTVLGDAFFTVLLFGGLALIEFYLPKLRERVLAPAAERVPEQQPAAKDEYVTADR
jgi:hypothetical protein